MTVSAHQVPTGDTHAIFKEDHHPSSSAPGTGLLGQIKKKVTHWDRGCFGQGSLTTPTPNPNSCPPERSSTLDRVPNKRSPPPAYYFFEIFGKFDFNFRLSKKYSMYLEFLYLEVE